MCMKKRKEMGLRVEMQKRLKIWRHRGEIAFFSGQMIYMDNWKMMMYLGTPVMPDLNALIATGLYINDLSMHDFSR